MNSISFVIPTLNADSTLDKCLTSINQQEFSGQTEIIIADGGSTDQSLDIAKKHQAKIVKNPLKTGEAGKAVGVKNAQYDLVCLLDSDNILTDKHWLNKMTIPFKNKRVIGAEPYKFSYQLTDGYIDRYCALMGMNDPLCYFIGNYDHFNEIDQIWHRMELETKELKDYWQIKLTSPVMPTMGANGAVFKRKFLNQLLADQKYLFDIDLLPQAVENQPPVYYAKVKTSIRHLFSGSSLIRFFRKQRRRQRDMLSRRTIKDIFINPDHTKRNYQWDEGSQLIFGLKILVFVLYCLTLIPLFVQAYLGYRQKKDSAWLAHPLLCWATFIAYGLATFEGLFINKELDRSNWKQ